MSAKCKLCGGSGVVSIGQQCICQYSPSSFAAPAGSAFRAGTGLMGSTEPGQRVTQRNVRNLPPGSVVRLDDGGRLIHLHDEVWLYCSDCAHCYDRIENMKWRLPGELCHLPPNRYSTALCGLA